MEQHQGEAAGEKWTGRGKGGGEIALARPGASVGPPRGDYALRPAGRIRKQLGPPQIRDPVSPSPAFSEPATGRMPRRQQSRADDGRRMGKSPARSPEGLDRIEPPDPRDREENPGSMNTSQILKKIDREVRFCTRCELCENRRQTVVYREHAVDARLMIISETQRGVGKTSGFPLVGKAGRILSRLIDETGVRRDRTFIDCIVKCRTPDNRPATHEELAACFPHVWRQILAVRPAVICSLGTVATTSLLGITGPMRQLRGRFRLLERPGPGTTFVVPTYHPEYLIRYPNRLEDALEDARAIRRYLRELRRMESDRTFSMS